MTPHTLPDHWRRTADDCARYGAASTAEALRQCAADLEAALAAPPVPATLQVAALASGYSVEHLGRLVRQGKLRNHGRKGAPRVALEDLPRRLPETDPAVYDPLADARALRSRRRAG